MKLTFIGFGEAGSAFAEGWRDSPPGTLAAYDIKLDDDAARDAMRARMSDLGVEAADSPAAALAGADIVLSLVTADQAVNAARAYAPHLAERALWCDLNSVAPSSKRAAAEIVGAAGARYLDVAVMAPVHPQLNLVPCLVAGPDSEDLVPRLADLPMTVRGVGDEVGRASSIKMIRSIMVKGLEALTAECALAARAAAVEDEVFPSLREGHPRIDLAPRAAYNFERSLKHGLRRAAEMDEVARTLSDLGLPDAMARSTAQWQRRLGALDIDAPDADADWSAFADRILQTMK